MDTPETDKAERMAWAGEYMVPTEVARKLERERDEANYFLKELAEADGQLKVRMHELCEVLQKAEQERDEARELAQQMSESNQVLMADTRFYRNAWEKLKDLAK
jgi:uncharacterized coiled-coil DUF342 family protein